MVKIQISKHIFRSCDTQELGSWARKIIKIPYAPFIGLMIHDGKGEIMEIKKIQYDCSDQITRCYVDPEYHEDYEYAKKHALEWGWKLREVPSGTVCKDVMDFF